MPVFIPAQNHHRFFLQIFPDAAQQGIHHVWHYGRYHNGVDFRNIHTGVDNSIRSSMPVSSEVRLLRVESRQFATSLSPSKTPNVLLVLLTSMTKIMLDLLCLKKYLSQKTATGTRSRAVKNIISISFS